MTAGLMPMMIPHFTVLHQRGLKRSYIAVYGAIVAFDAIQVVPTVVQVATAAGLSDASKARNTKRVLSDLVRMGLLDVIRHSYHMTRYVPRGPRLHQAPANDNGTPHAQSA